MGRNCTRNASGEECAIAGDLGKLLTRERGLAPVTAKSTAANCDIGHRDRGITVVAVVPNPMIRRDFIILFSSAAVAWPRFATSEPSDMVRRIGVLMTVSEGDAEVQPHLIAFQKTLQDLGWADGRNVRIDYRLAAADPGRIRAAAAELVRLKPDVLLAQSTTEAKALLEQTRIVPIVSPMLSDPIGSGLVKSFANPGGSVTGFTSFEEGMAGKWLGLLKEIGPDVTGIAIVLHPQDEAPSSGVQRAANAAASSLGVELTLIRDAHIERAFDAFALDAVARKANIGLIVLPGIYTRAYRYLILALAAKYGWPAIYPSQDYVKAGGLMSYGTEISDAFRQAAVYVDQILQGAKPSQLPVQAPTNLHLVINLWAAKVLGLTVPPSLLARADEVIE
jgi:putative tryptophan/tyrosine transport system substrate-binding protein